MIHHRGREIGAASFGSRLIGAIYKGARLVWQAVRSCFGSGFWQNDKPWSDDESWMN